MRIVSFFGMFVMLGIAWLFSKNKKAINYKAVAAGTLLQIILAALIMKVPAGQRFFMFLNDVIVKLLSFTNEGSKFVFGPLGDPKGSLGMVFAFQALPLIIYVAAVLSILYYVGVLPALVTLAAKAMFKLMGTSGASVWPTKMFALATSDSAPEEFIKRVITQAKAITIFCMMPR